MDPIVVMPFLEYGSGWKAPVSNWEFADSPHNRSPEKRYTFDGPQMERFGKTNSEIEAEQSRHRIVRFWFFFLLSFLLGVVYIVLPYKWTRAYVRLPK